MDDSEASFDIRALEGIHPLGLFGNSQVLLLNSPCS